MNTAPELFTPLVRVCRLLQEHGARYLVIGGQACILHGLVRTTEDVDLLIASKQTHREIDAADRLRLEELRRRRAAPPGN